MHCSRSSGSPERTISTHPILVQPGNLKPLGQICPEANRESLSLSIAHMARAVLPDFLERRCSRSTALQLDALQSLGDVIASDELKLTPPEIGHRAVPIPKAVRKRDKAHRDFVCSQPCLICGRRPSDAHHIRFGQLRALGRRVSDEFTVPLCRVHHRDPHRFSDEKRWWEAAKIEPMEIAQRLWRETRDQLG